MIILHDVRKTGLSLKLTKFKLTISSPSHHHHLDAVLASTDEHHAFVSRTWNFCFHFSLRTEIEKCSPVNKHLRD